MGRYSRPAMTGPELTAPDLPPPQLTAPELAAPDPTAQRRLPGSVLVASYNMLYLFEDDSPSGQEHYRQVLEIIRAVDADILAVQEIRAPTASAAADRLRQLAADAGRSCLVPAAGTRAGGQPAVGAGSRGFHTGLIWRDGIEPVGGSLRSYGGSDFWHSLVLVTLDVGGQLVPHGAHHAAPFGRRLRADQNERLIAALAAGTSRNRSCPAVVGADWNTECADRIPARGTGTGNAGTGGARGGDPGAADPADWVLYEPGDPFAGAGWFPGLIHQCGWDYDARGRRRHWADRYPGDVLWAGGLHDAAAALRAPWQATAGHWPDDPYGQRGIRRRIDAIRVTAGVTGALRTHRVLDTGAARAASDHLPVLVEYLPSAIVSDPPGGAGGPMRGSGR